MMQKGLIKNVLEFLVLNINITPEIAIPVKGKATAKHLHKEPASDDFNFQLQWWR